MLRDESILLIYMKFYKENKMKFFLISLVLIVTSLEGENTFISKNDKYNFLKEATNGIIKESWVKKIKLLHGKFNVSIEKKNILYNEESEGVIFSIKDSKETTLILTSIKDDFLDRFKFYFVYSKITNQFKLYKVYYLSYSEGCGYDLNAIYEVENQIFKNMTLENFDGKATHKLLYEKSVWINKGMKLHKIQSIELTELYNEVFKLYKNDKIKFKEYVSDFVYKGCQLKYYFKQKYYFQKNIELSNNIAFFLEEAEHYKESIYLLEKILKDYPNRTVAHYNLADAYWALGEKKKAISSYTTYIEQMKEKGKEKRIPQVVRDRVSSQ